MDSLDRLKLEEMLGVGEIALNWQKSKYIVSAVVGNVVLGMMPREKGYVSVFCHPAGSIPRNVEELTILGSYCGADQRAKQLYETACNAANPIKGKTDPLFDASVSTRLYEIQDIKQEKERLNGLLGYVRNTLLK